ncbi:MAG: TonB-dependent receptor [Kofleriaceae bacterium]|nr:TonB-dependent receptor [Kofleriaceae bacterium]
MTSRTLHAWLLLTAVTLVSTAHAETATWNGFRALGVPDEQVALLEYVTTNALDDPGLIDRIVTDSKVAERCGPDIACQCEAIRKKGVRYGAFGAMGKLGNSWTIELTLLDAHSCTITASGYFDETLADDAVGPRLTALAHKIATPSAEVAATATVTGQAKPIDATPAIVTTFTRSQLRALQLRNLEDLFPLVTGFDIVDASWGGVVLNQGLPSTLLFMADSVPLVNGLAQFRATQRDFRTSFAHVDRIEIVRGPGSVLWGQNAFLGVVNVIGETPTRRQPAVEAGLQVGSLDTQEVWVRGAQNRGRFAFAASVDVGRAVGPTIQVEDSPQAILGVPTPPPFGNGGATKPFPDRWIDAYVRFALANRIELTVQNLTNETFFEISTRGALLDADKPGYWKKTHRLYSLVGTEPLHEAEGAKLTLRGALSRYELYSWENFAVSPRYPDGPEPAMGGLDVRNGVRSVQGNDDPRVAHYGDVRMIHDYTLGFENHLTAGMGVLHVHTPDSLATIVGVDTEPATHTVSFPEKDFVTVSGFAFDELTPLPWLVLDAGTRVQLEKPYADGAAWRFGARFQGGAAVRSGPLGLKAIYSEGFRQPDAVLLYSTVGTQGNPALQAELSREVAALASLELAPGAIVRAGGNITRISDLVVLGPPDDPKFLYKPINSGRIDLVSGYVEAQLTSRQLDAFANFHVTDLDESAPVGTGIPLAKFTGAVAGIWRPIADVSLFVRGSFASPRRLRQYTADDPYKYVETSANIRSAVGLTLTDAIAGADFDLMVDNPLLQERASPYQLDGTTTYFIERRTGTEVRATLRYDR